MLKTIAHILQRDCKIHAKNLILVGLSGGPDSLCLLHVVHQLGYRILAAHVNHALRPEADGEAQVVEQFARQLGVDFITCRLDVPAFASENSMSIEEAARLMRYQYLFAQAAQAGARAVLVGHTADDQVETILMHLFRGSGLTGLRGMEYCSLPSPWSEQIPLVRPLLSTWREEITRYLAEHDLHPVSDSSNVDTRFFRNRLRHELLPVLEGYNPRLRENLLRMGQILRDDYAVLQPFVAEAWNKLLVQQGPGYLALRQDGFLELSPSIQRYILRKAIAYHLPGLRDVDFECIERGLGLLSGANPHAQIDLISGLRIIKDGELFWVASWKADLPIADFPAIKPGTKFTLGNPASLALNDNWIIYTEEAPDTGLAISQSNANSDPFQAWLDESQLQLPLIVRPRQAGDRIQPLGMDGKSIKVSDLMINLKLPHRARASWPLVCSGKDIVWIPGCRMSHLARLEPGSQSIIHIALRRNSAA